MPRRPCPARWSSPAASFLAAPPRPAEGPYRNRDNKDPKDLSEGTYPIPYQKPTVAEIREVLERVRGYLEASSPTQVVDGRTGSRDHRLLGAERRGEDPGRSRRGVLSTRLHHGRHALRDAARHARSPATGDSRSTRGGSSSSSPTASRTSARWSRRARDRGRRPSGPSSQPARSTTRGPCAPPS